MNALRIIILLSVIGLALSVVTRVKVGSKRWAFHLEVNEGKNVRKEWTDESGVTHGTFTFVGHDNSSRQCYIFSFALQLEYKFDLTAEEPDISFSVVNQESAQSLESNETTTTAPTNPSDNSSSIQSTSEPNYESIDGEEEFTGHVSIKVGKNVYFINFLSGDKSAAREEAFDENGLIYGKYTFFNEAKLSKIVVNYKFNSSGSDPTFEFSLYKKNEPNRLNPLENESNTNTYYDPNRVNRRVLLPSAAGPHHPYARQNRPHMPSVTLQSTNPPHNIITPMQGNWYYRVQ
ncbi:unnamed protein product [Medioppia subpectinata]|uniref:Uncharacterized protein n=1 Tax=Medioppia subpectinata TaxID=1979941 RepID=A0A7R9KUS5_9ACAR|nr:unnamed protein product [Medioppia subpectinata]CAG2110244.1 unnamed protein product [Medioppia subpectinata]